MTTVVADLAPAKNKGNTEGLHELHHCWKYYYFLYKKGAEWADCLREVATFDTVEYFWSVFEHSDKPSGTMNGTDIYMFRSTIQPKWEDPKNENGGRWLLNFNSPTDGDQYWEELLMLLVGSDWDTDEEADQICGAVYQPRTRGQKIAVWLTDGQDQDTILRIGKRIKDRLSFPDKIFFHTVEDQRDLPRGKDVVSGRYEI